MASGERGAYLSRSAVGGWFTRVDCRSTVPNTDSLTHRRVRAVGLFLSPERDKFPSALGEGGLAQAVVLSPRSQGSRP